MRFEIEFGVRIRVIIGDIFKTIKVKGGGGGGGGGREGALQPNSL